MEQENNMPPGTPEPPIRSDSAGHEGHMLDKYLRGIDRPGPVFRNHHDNNIASKRSVPGGPRQEKQHEFVG
jgi:hypothetical protein